MTWKTCMTNIMFVVVLQLTTPVHAVIRYVKADAIGANNGTNWQNAYTSLQSAIGDLQATDIWVAYGTYSPGALTTSTFLIKNGVNVRGGFFGTPGSEGNLNARNLDPTTNYCVLTGVFSSGIGNVATVITGNVLIASTTFLDGFTASPVCAGDKLYFTSEDGDVYVVQDGPEFKLLGKNSIGEPSMATPAIIGNTLIVRGQKHLFAIGEKK